jgi:hypothetical protein
VGLSSLLSQAAITACLLAEAGRDVLLIEEDISPVESLRAVSKDELEPKCTTAGRRSQWAVFKLPMWKALRWWRQRINSGLYHRTPPDILERWRKNFGWSVVGVRPDPHFETCERDSPSHCCRVLAPTASRKLHDGARLG